MKKTLITATCIIAALYLLIAISCSKKKNPAAPEATSTPEQTLSCTITPTFTITPTPIEVSDFEGNTMEFWAPGCCTFTASVVGTTGSVAPYSGNYMAALTLQGAAFDGGDDADTALFQYDKSSENPLPNFQNRTIIVHVWIPDYFTTGPYVLQIFFVGGGTNYMWHSEWIFLHNFSPAFPTYVDSPVVETVKPNSWNTLWYPITPSDQGYADASQVDSYGIELIQNGGANSAAPGEAIYVDDIIVQ